jgi:hypothetical protein
MALSTEQTKRLEEINDLFEKSVDATLDYWIDFSGFDTWQFWVLTGFLILPLLAMYFLIDRRKAVLIGFFGFNIHVWFHYIDLIVVTRGLVAYPYKVIPFLPSSVTLDTAFVPVTFMLLYQWTLNKDKNFYLYATGYSAFLSFLFKPAMVNFDLFRLYKGVNYLHLFLLYIIIFLVSKWITNFFLYLQKHIPGSTTKTSTFNRVPFGKRHKGR